MAFFGFRKDKRAQEEKSATDAKVRRRLFSRSPKSTSAKHAAENADEPADSAIERAPKKRRADAATGTDFGVILRPRITEKATDLSTSRKVYTFEVRKHATKKEIADAVRDLYHVTPTRVNMAMIRGKRIASRRVRNTFGMKAGGKKAYVTLKKGDTIEFV